MITKGMSTNEVLKELQKDDRVIHERTNGLKLKNRKKLKNRFVKHNEIMSVSNWVIPETQNEVVVYATKNLMTLKGKDYASMCISYYYKTPYGTYIMPFFNETTLSEYMEVSSHAVDRIKERLHKDFDTFFKEDWIKKNESTMAIVDYKYNGNKYECVAHIGDAFMIMEEDASGKKTTIKTVLDTSKLYVNQLKCKLNSKKAGEYYSDWLQEQIDSISEAHLKVLRRMGVVMKVA